jgi:peptide chain release factor 2
LISFGGLFDIDGKKRRVDEIAHLESDPTFWDNNIRAKETLKEKATLELTLKPFADAQRRFDDISVLLELGSESGGLDSDSQKEIEESLVFLDEALRKLELNKMLSGERDSSDAFIEIHSGAGGTEACDWTGILARMYTRYAADRGFECEMVDFTDGDGAGYRSVAYEIRGPFAYGFLKAESGVHRLVRISPFDSAARRHTSFASVYVYPSVEEDIKIEVRTEDLRIDTYRAGGAGGQHVNKTDSAVRITHLPTNIVVQCQAERSQIQNRERAMKMLKARLYELEMRKRQEEIDKANAEKKDIGWGSQIRNYVLQPYQMVKDVRTKLETSSVDKVLDGDLQPFIEAYLMMNADAKA